MDKEKTDTGRRSFLKLAGVSAPAAVAAASLSADQAAAMEAEDAGEGLRETAHVKTYFETARF